MWFTPSKDGGKGLRRTGQILGLGILAGALAGALYSGSRASTRAAQPFPTTAHPPAQQAKAAKVTALGTSTGLAFEPNQGQTDRSVQFLSRNSHYNLFLTSDEAVFTLGSHPAQAQGKVHHSGGGKKSRPSLTKESVLRMRMVGAHPRAVRGSEPTQGRTNYLIGRDPAKWVENVPQFSRVRYDAIYPGVDLTFYGNESALEFDLIVKPGADPHQIALRFTGARQIQTNAAGDLVLSSEAGNLALKRPVAYQTIDGARKPVEARFVEDHRNQFKIALGNYDRRRELVIDPSVLYSTFLGGRGADQGHAIAVDSTGAVYMTGQTSSTDFPKTSGAAQSTLLGNTDAFVTKFTAAGNALVYSTYLGGANQVGTEDKGPTSSGNAIVIDAAGNAYIAGGTNTSDFPLCPAANHCPAPAQAAYGGSTGDAFVVKINPTGGLAYSSFIGGSGDDVAEGIAIDASGNIYVGGQTASTNLSVVQPLQSANKGMNDGFIAKIDGTAGSGTLGQFKYLDYLGGTGADLVTGIGLDQSNNIYVSGITISTDFPVHGTAPYQSKCGTDGKCNPNAKGAQDDSFITAIKSDLSQYIYSTYFGGSGGDDAETMVVDSAGDVYFTGLTSSTDLATVNPYSTGLKPTANNNVFVAELDPAGSTAKYLTYLGGGTADIAFGLALDSASRIYLTGQTLSSDFPIVKPIQSVIGGDSDAFVALLDPSKAAGNQLLFSTFIGGTGAEDTQFGGVALDTAGNIYVTGDTASAATGSLGFPILDAYQNTLKGPSDAFLTKISPTANPVANFTVDVSAINPSTISVGSSATSTVTVTSQNGFAGNVNLTCKLTPSAKVPPTCTFASNSVTVPANGTVQTTLTVGTSSPTASLRMKTSLPMVGFAFAVPGLLGLRRRRRLYFLGACLILTALLLMPGCVSGSGSGGSPGTTTGAYQFTVTGDSLGARVTTAAQSITVQ